MLLKKYDAQQWVMVSIFFLISLCFWCAIPKPAGHYDVDSYGYDAIASYFAQTGTLTDPNNPSSAPIQPVGYHAILGVLFGLFGHNIQWVVLFQILLMGVCLILLQRIAEQLFGVDVARYAGLLFLGCLGVYLYPQLLLAETVLLFVLLLLFERYLHFLVYGSAYDLSWSGFLLGLSMLIKPVGLVLIAPLAVITWQTGASKKWARALLLLFCFAVPIVCYMGRNAINYGSFSFAPMGPLNIYQCFLAKVMSIVEQKDQQEIIDRQLRFEGKHSFDSTGWNNAQAYFWQYLRQYPKLFVRVWFVNICKTWFGLYATQLKRMVEPVDHTQVHSYFQQRGNMLKRVVSYIQGGTLLLWVQALAWMEAFYAMIRFMLAVIGLSYVWYQRKKELFWFFVSVLISFSILTGIDGCCRYRLTFELILLLLAALGLRVLCMYLHADKKGKDYCYEVCS